MKRIVEPELLDALPADDPHARRSRQDLRRVNHLMGNARILARELDKLSPQNPSLKIVELGAGDGYGLLQAAQRLGRGQKFDATLVDRQDLVTEETRKAFAAASWSIRLVAADVFDFLVQAPDCDVMVANLFLHHFTEDKLRELLRHAAGRARCFIAVEPRRAAWPLFCSRLLGLVGSNAVTRHDAVVSVRAGFCDGELSALWPDRAGWNLSERAAGPFSHLFVAQREGEA
jgi:SAM-dependent methyltransferase